jgi:hypothetical protein
VAAFPRPIGKSRLSDYGLSGMLSHCALAPCVAATAVPS